MGGGDCCKFNMITLVWSMMMTMTLMMMMTMTLMMMMKMVMMMMLMMMRRVARGGCCKCNIITAV